MARKNIVWNPTEREHIALVSFRNMQAGYSKMESIRQAVMTLPIQLQRQLNSVAEVPWIISMWDDFRRNQTTVAQPQPAIQPVVNPQVEKDVPAPALDLSQLPTAALMNEVLKRLSDMLDPQAQRRMIRDEVNSILERRLPGVLAPDIEPEPEIRVKERARLSKVCVLGLDNAQKSMLASAYRGIIDFHFLDGDEGNRRVKATIDLMDFSLKSKWVKGSPNGFKNLQQANGLDTIRRLINDKFKVQPVDVK